MVRSTALALLALSLAGCGTVNSWASGCPAAYSGVRTDAEYLRSYGSFWDDGFDQVTVAGDLPLSAIADTLSLPLAATRSGKPQPPGLGCGWAVEEGPRVASSHSASAGAPPPPHPR